MVRLPVRTGGNFSSPNRGPPPSPTWRLTWGPPYLAPSAGTPLERERERERRKVARTPQPLRSDGHAASSSTRAQAAPPHLQPRAASAPCTSAGRRRGHVELRSRPGSGLGSGMDPPGGATPAPGLGPAMDPPQRELREQPATPAPPEGAAPAPWRREL